MNSSPLLATVARRRLLLLLAFISILSLSVSCG
ncbi:MAG: hypothetical protein QOG71_816, partial [Pyrinomonadaceae bacterium]|nr:hypothetical protein [Pyrinomonadaceae bacterium]